MYLLDSREIDKLFGLTESSIDFPKEGLDSTVWEKKGDEYMLSTAATTEILKALEGYPDLNLLEAAAEIWIVGSICTNLYEDDSDIDVHVQLKDGFSPELQKSVMKWSKQNKHFIRNNPIEIYLQDNPAQDMATSDAVYDMRAGKWLKGPALVDKDYNPYEVYSSVLTKVSDLAKEADVSLGELKRDVIDYQVIKDAVGQLPEESKAKVKAFLDDKLAEVNSIIDELLKDKKEWIDYRRSTKMTNSPEDAIKDVETVRKWKDVNATFKLLNRYGLLKVITALEDIAGEDKIVSHEDVPSVAAVVGVEDVP